VPIGYLVFVAFVAACTLAALWPRRHPRPLALASWWLGSVLDELPFAAFYLLAAATALALADGDVRSGAGWAVVVLAALTAIGLGVVVARGVRARPALEHALVHPLGPRRAHLARVLLWPFPRRPRNVRRIRNVRYGAAGRNSLLDVYLPRSGRPTGPTLVHLHGGGFHRGAKSREGRPLFHRLADRGWVCISANYHLRPAGSFHDQLVDVKLVIAWARTQGANLGADTERIVVSGSSVGAHLAAMAALTPLQVDLEPPLDNADTSVVACVGLYGYYGPADAEKPLASSPGPHVGPHALPAFIVHGDDDTFTPVEGARAFVDQLRAASANRVVYAELPGAQHSFDVFHSLRFEAVIDAIEVFVEDVAPRQPG
jgi:acetyl esterase/lipase